MSLKKGKSKMEKTKKEKLITVIDDREHFKMFDKYMRLVRQHNKKRLEERKRLRKLKRDELKK